MTAHRVEDVEPCSYHPVTLVPPVLVECESPERRDSEGLLTPQPYSVRDKGAQRLLMR
jgi:hypothetical protein